MGIVVTYIMMDYTPKAVTGRYVRCEGAKRRYKFRVFETATCTDRGQFYMRPGMGGTLREYVTTGEELPEALKAECIRTKQTTTWTL